MKSDRAGKRWIGVLCAVVLVGGGASLLSSPTATASSGINWGHIWKTQLEPRADRRYYTKKKSDQRYYTKASAQARFAAQTSLSGYTPTGTAYTKAESDARYAPGSALADYYSKLQSDARYAPYPSVIRGAYDVSGVATDSGQYLTSSISFGVTLLSAPTVHFIAHGEPVPSGCSGTPAAPDAAPGNLCIFDDSSADNTASQGTYDPANGSALATSNPMGITVFATSDGPGQVFTYGTWALRPQALSTSRTVAGAPVTGSGARADRAVTGR